jgi:hypothetical protein
MGPITPVGFGGVYATPPSGPEPDAVRNAIKALEDIKAESNEINRLNEEYNKKIDAEHDPYRKQALIEEARAKIGAQLQLVLTNCDSLKKFANSLDVSSSNSESLQYIHDYILGKPGVTDGIEKNFLKPDYINNLIDRLQDFLPPTSR